MLKLEGFSTSPIDLRLVLRCADEGTGPALAAAHAATLWRALYRDAETSLEDRHDFPPPLRRWLTALLGPGRTFSIDSGEVATAVVSGDGLTRKFLLRFPDGATVETVLMGYPGRFTACVSTQVGCAMGCGFCATGQMGFTRHLRAGEIVTQVLHAQRVLRANGLSGLRNVVLMGMGEPLHNYDAVMAALEMMTDSRGLNLGPSRITISTVGVVPGILRLARERQPYRLAVSLHAATPRRTRGADSSGPPMAARGAPRGLPELLRSDAAQNLFRVDLDRRGQRFAGRGNAARNAAQRLERACESDPAQSH